MFYFQDLSFYYMNHCKFYTNTVQYMHKLQLFKMKLKIIKLLYKQEQIAEINACLRNIVELQRLNNVCWEFLIILHYEIESCIRCVIRTFRSSLDKTNRNFYLLLPAIPTPNNKLHVYVVRDKFQDQDLPALQVLLARNGQLTRIAFS